MARKGKSDKIMKKLPLIKQLSQEGYTDAQIIKRLGIASSTFYKYKKMFSEFPEILESGKAHAENIAEEALLSAAIGGKYEEVIKIPVYCPDTNKIELDDNGKPKYIITKVVEKTALPNVAAIMHWLRGRRPEVWGNRRNTINAPSVADAEDDDL